MHNMRTGIHCFCICAQNMFSLNRQ